MNASFFIFWDKVWKQMRPFLTEVVKIATIPLQKNVGWKMRYLQAVIWSTVIVSTKEVLAYPLFDILTTFALNTENHILVSMFWGLFTLCFISVVLISSLVFLSAGTILLGGIVYVVFRNIFKIK